MQGFYQVQLDVVPHGTYISNTYQKCKNWDIWVIRNVNTVTIPMQLTK